MKYHVPVMLSECVSGLEINPAGTYVDLTFGGGGHSRVLAEKLGTGRLYSFDQDDEAAENAKTIDSSQFTFVKANFRHLKKFLKLYGVKKVDGILADLGVSSHQFDAAERGFSFQGDARLDMRMNQNQELSAFEVVNTYSEGDLHRIFGMYGEIKNAKSLAQLIVLERSNKEIVSTSDLVAVAEKKAPKFKEYKYYAQLFQALRIEVNDELKALEEMLVQCAEVLAEDGKLVVMSYHSLEDRLVKSFIQKGKFYGEVEKDLYGNPLKPLVADNRKPIEANEKEVEENPRARSAKLRIATRNDFSYGE